MNYSPENLASLISALEYENEIIRLKHNFDFDDCSVEVKGHLYGDFDYDFGDFWTAPYIKLTGVYADIEEVVIGYPEITEFLCYEEIKEIEKLLSW